MWIRGVLDMNLIEKEFEISGYIFLGAQISGYINNDLCSITFSKMLFLFSIVVWHCSSQLDCTLINVHLRIKCNNKNTLK